MKIKPKMLNLGVILTGLISLVGCTTTGEYSSTTAYLTSAQPIYYPYSPYMARYYGVSYYSNGYWPHYNNAVYIQRQFYNGW